MPPVALDVKALSMFLTLVAANMTLPEVKSIAAIVLSFNHARNVRDIARHLHKEDVRVVVAEDGSKDGSKDEWARALHSSDLMVHTDDVHEIRAYNNAARHVNSSVLCFLQDDDIPSDPGWANRALDLFNRFRHERLAVLSGLAAEICQVEVGEQQVDHPPGMKNFKRTKPIPFASKGEPFMFTTEAWLAPMCIRRHVFQELGGFDESLTLPGEPGIGLDIHLSLRAELLGYTIGVFGALFERGVGGHGTVSDLKKAERRLRKRQEISLRIRQVAGCRWPPSMLAHIEKLNAKYLELRSPGTLDDIHNKCRPFLSRPCNAGRAA